MANKKFFITPEQLKADYIESPSMSKLANKYGVSKKLVMNYMNRYGFSRKHAVEIPIDRLKNMAEIKMSAVEIAKVFGTNKFRILITARNNNIKIFDSYHPGIGKTESGYLLVLRPNHREADNRGYVRLHRLIMEEHIGRQLTSSEVVHHVNGIKSDNRIENLRLMSIGEHVSFHHTGKKGRGKSKT